MEATSYGYRTLVRETYEEAIPRVTEALKAQGFGVLTEIDVKATLKKKLDVDFRKYIILGACNPSLAHKALSAEVELGIFLPCNVIVYEDDQGQTVVSAMNPQAAMQVVENSALQEVAAAVADKLRKVIQSLEE